MGDDIVFLFWAFRKNFTYIEGIADSNDNKYLRNSVYNMKELINCFEKKHGIKKQHHPGVDFYSEMKKEGN